MKVTLTHLFLLLAAVVHCQNITFTKIPQDWQLFQRNLTTNKATIQVTGTVAQSAGYSRLEFRLFNETTNVSTVARTLVFSASSAPFSVNIEIPTARNNHRIEVHGFKTTTNAWVLEKQVTKLLSGDIFIINGQSNAIANSSPDLSDIDEYTRSWWPPYGWGTLNLSYPGQWGARLANRIADDLQIPVSIINCAQSADPISSHKKNATDPNAGLYGTVLRRFEQAGLEKKARALFWFHGEANGWDYASQPYVDDFEQIKNTYKADFGLERVFLYQMRFRSCSSARPFIMEAHRQIAANFTDTEIMSSNAAAHDGCHFYYQNGYQSLGDRMFDLVANHFYGRNVAEAVPAEPDSAFISAPNQITIKFKNTTSLLATGNPWRDFRTHGDSVPVLSGLVTGNKVIITFTQNLTSITGVSYYGHPGDDNNWVTNSRGVGLLSFHNFLLTAPNTGGGGTNTPPDLSLTGTATNNNPLAYSFVSTTFSLKNSGEETANNVAVSVPLTAGLVYRGGSEFTATRGTFNTQTGVWAVGNVAQNDSIVLTINYFTLNATAKTVFAQVSAAGGTTDSDSAPNNGISPNAVEDDEAAINLNGGTTGGGGGGGSTNKPDLELALTANTLLPGQWKNVGLNLTIKNNGTAAASNIVVRFMNMSDPNTWSKIAYVAATAPAGTTFNNWAGEWKITTLAAGATLTLNYGAFTKVATSIVVFGQVTAQTETDSDSSPNNAANQTATEDDEVRISLNGTNLQGGSVRQQQLSLEPVPDFTLYPNPANEVLNVELQDWAADVSGDKPLFVEIFSQNGQSVFAKKVTEIQDNTLNINLLDIREEFGNQYFLLIQFGGYRGIAQSFLLVSDK